MASCSGWNYHRLRGKSVIYSEDFREEIKYTPKFNLIVLPVVINGKQYEFLFDTGASNTIISEELAVELGLKVRGRMSIRDSKNNTRKMELTLIDSMAIAGVKFGNISANIIQWPENSAVECVGRDGIIGNNLIRHCNWLIDYKNETLTITDGELIEDGMYTTTMKYPRNRPRFSLTMDSLKLENVLLDVGSGGALDVSKDIYSKNKLADMKYPQNKEVDGSSQGLFGASLDTVLNFMPDSIHIEGWSIYNPVVEVERKPGAKIGNLILRNGRLMLDYKNEVIGIAPYKLETKYKTGPSLAFVPLLKSGEMTISTVVKGSDAWNAGLRHGQKVTSLNGKSIDEYPQSYCDYFSLLFNDVLKRDTIALTIDGMENEIRIKASRLWPEN